MLANNPLKLLISLIGLAWSSALAQDGQEPASARSGEKLLPAIPLQLPEVDRWGEISIEHNGQLRKTTLIPELQSKLDRFIRNQRSPIAAVVVVDVATGSILALSQGRAPEAWDSPHHSAIYPAFPAASLFKTVVAAGALEITDLDIKEQRSLYGGCQHVRPTGIWMKDTVPSRRNHINLRRAYGRSCNSFFAKVAINHLGLGIITQFAHRFGWETGFPADFAVEPSPFFPPEIGSSSVHTVGRYAAGFGRVGTSAVHAAWRTLVVARNGSSIPLRLFVDTPLPDRNNQHQVVSPATAQRLRSMMDASILGGTASFAFRKGRHRKLRKLVGGKTGTLSGRAPRGVTTWFAGMMPLANPEIVVAAVVVLEDLWFIKGPHLAAEAFLLHYKRQRNMISRPALPVVSRENQSL